MSENENILYAPKTFDLLITAANQKFSETFQLDKSVIKVTGLAFASEKPDLPYTRGFARIEINKREFFPENHPVQRIMNGINTGMDIRYWPLKNVIIGNGQVKFEYTDKHDGRTVFAPYTIQLILDCESEII